MDAWMDGWMGDQPAGSPAFGSWACLFLDSGMAGKERVHACGSRWLSEGGHDE
jgi:hypothetical protein